MLNDDLEVIDFERKGNLVRLYLGKNGNQWGDDWNDAPYKTNAGKVYDQFIQEHCDIIVNFDYDIIEPEGFNISKEDMRDRKVAAFKIVKEGEIKALIYFGDNIQSILKLNNNCKVLEI